MAKKRRTKAQVLRQRGTVVGCCERHADNKACDCLEEASGPMPDPVSPVPAGPPPPTFPFTGPTGATFVRQCPMDHRTLHMLAAGREACPLCDAQPPPTFSSEKAAAADLTIITFQYRNHRGEVSMRRVYPVSLWFGSTCYHPIGQWLLKAFDLDRQGQRDFAMSGVLGPWESVKVL